MSTDPSSPQPPRGPRGILVVVVAVVVFGAIALGITALIGMGWSVVAPTDGDPGAAPEPDIDTYAETFAYVTEVGDSSVTVDPAQLLRGQEARDAAVDDGLIEAGEELPNDFYVDNPEPEELTLEVADEVDVTVLTLGPDGAITETSVELAELATAFAGEEPGVAIYGLAPGEFPVTLTVAGGVVTEMEQVYLP